MAAKTKKNKSAVVKVNCPACGELISPSDAVADLDYLYCPECGEPLQVTGLDPLQLEIADMGDEDEEDEEFEDEDEDSDDDDDDNDCDDDDDDEEEG